MPGLNDLPAELACQILESLTIEEVFTARSVSRSFLRFVDRHVGMIAYRLARRDFPHARLLVRPSRRGGRGDESGGEGIYDLAWLRSLTPRRLASIVLDKHRVHRRHTASSYVLYIPAEDTFGDELRAQLTGAWCMLRRINAVYRDVYAQLAGADTEQQEALVCERAVALVDGAFSPARCEAFCLLAYLLLSAFTDETLPATTTWRDHLIFHVARPGEPPCFFDCEPRNRHVSGPLSLFSRGGGASQEVVVDGRNPDRGNAWVWSFLFREGAEAFRRQWIDGERDPSLRRYVGDCVRCRWATRWLPTTISAERECASRIWYAIVARSRARPEESTPLTPPPGYDSLKNPPNDIAFPAINRWHILRHQAKREEGPGRSMLAWHLWRKGKMDIDGECGAVEDWMTKEEATELLDNNPDTDSLHSVPYPVRF